MLSCQHWSSFLPFCITWRSGGVLGDHLWTT